MKNARVVIEMIQHQVIWPMQFIASQSVEYILNKVGKHYAICIPYSFKEHTYPLPGLQKVCKMGITQVSVLPPREKLKELRTEQEFIPGQNKVKRRTSKTETWIWRLVLFLTLTPLYYEIHRKWMPQAAFVGKYLVTNAINFSFESKMTIQRDKWEGTYIWYRTVISNHRQNNSADTVVMEDFWV